MAPPIPSVFLSLSLVAIPLAPPLAHARPAEDPASTPTLPPLLPWSGASEDFVVGDDDPWITPCEQSGLTATPSYDATMAWIERLVDAAPELKLTSIGRSPEGRDLWMVIASKEGAASPLDLAKNGRPTVLAQAGIHSGEIDGKDAGMMLLRDLTVGARSSLLDGVNLLFVPILSVDAHERSSRFSRINQRGPVEMGWRTNSTNLNLNRDYTKGDTPEMRAMLGVLSSWPIDLYIDLHVTDGVDYQYDVTYGFNGPHAWSPIAANLLLISFRPKIDAALRAMGHVPGDLVFAVDPSDITQGNGGWTASPRYSNGYGDARHLPTVLVENHSLKPYRRRVLGTYVFLREALTWVTSHGDVLRAATLADRKVRANPLPVSFLPGTPEPIDFLGIRSRLIDSPITGGKVVEWLGEAVTQRIPFIPMNRVGVSVSRPDAYWIPAPHADVIERLRLHGIEMSTLEEPLTRNVVSYTLDDPTFDRAPFEGRFRVRSPVSRVERVETFPAGSVRVPTAQPLGDLAMLLLEPESEDSFFQWGFFLGSLQRTEYVEAYVMEPTARRMLAADPLLQAEFESALEDDASLRDNPQRRLQWFYRRTPFFDARWRIYPVAREES